MSFLKSALFVAALCTGCHGSLYTLPAPPPPEERKEVSLIPGEEQRQAEEVYLEARTRILEIYKLLTTRRFDEVTPMLSLESRDFLKSMGGGAEVAEVLASGKLRLTNGEVVDFSPVTTLLAEDISKLSDTIAGVEEHETSGRKEIFATLPSGKLQRIVLISEGGQWVLHRTRLSEPFDPPQAP